jgi:arabinogalactan oligomer/maltooligosaccharide transport system substrate-binding protein
MALAMLLPALALASGEPVTLLVWEAEGDTGDLEFVRQAAAKYTELNPHISFEFNSVAHTDAVQKLELDGPAMVGADLFAAPHDKLGQMVVGELALPNPYADELQADFLDAAVTAVTYDGVSYGYPLAIETYALFYNKDLIAEPLATWEEIIAFCAEYNDPAADKFGIVWEVNAPYYNYLFLSAYGADLFGPEGLDKAAHSVNTPEAIKGMEYFASLRDALLPVNGDDLNGDFCTALFRDSRTAALYITGPWNIGNFLNAGMNFGITTLPELPDTGTPPTSFSGVRAMFVSAFSEYPEEAQAFARFLTSKEMLELRYEITGNIPPRKDIVIDNEYSAGILAQAAYAKPMPSIPAMDGYWTTMGSAFRNIWNGADIASELNAAAEYIEAIP